MPKKKAPTKKKTTKTKSPSKKKKTYPSGIIFTWDNGGRASAMHESGIMIAEASTPLDLVIPPNFFTLEGTPVLLRDCGVEAILPEEVGEHVGLNSALDSCACRQAVERAVPASGPMIIQGELPS